MLNFSGSNYSIIKYLDNIKKFMLYDNIPNYILTNNTFDRLNFINIIEKVY